MTEMMQTLCKRTRVFVGVLLPTLLVAACGGIEPTGTTLRPTGPLLNEAPVAPVDHVVISQVYGGGGNTGAQFTHDFVELYNPTSEKVSLEGWSVQYASATGTGDFGANSALLIELTGSIAPGQYYLIQLSGGATGRPLPQPDLAGTSRGGLIPAGATAGKFALVKSKVGLGCNGAGTRACSPDQRARIVDLVGYGNANFYEGLGSADAGPAPTLSNITAAFRKHDGAQDTDNNKQDFVAKAPKPYNPDVLSTQPADGGANVATDANVVVTFTQPVNVEDGWFTISCATSGSHPATSSSADATTFTLDPETDFVRGEACTTKVFASKVRDQAKPVVAMRGDRTWSFSVTTVNPCEQPFMPVPQIQGDEAATPHAGKVVSTQGVVVGDYEGATALRGFYLQDATGDGDAATSDAIFVFKEANTDQVGVGDLVRVTGVANESQDQTRITVTPSGITVCGTGASVTPTNVELPFASATFPERYEGMLVRFSQTLSVTEHFQLGRFGQVVLSSGGRLFQPTSIVAPGAAALAMQAANNLNRIIVDDAEQIQNPVPILFGRGGSPLSASNTLRGGDEVTGLVGVMTYTWAGNSASGNAYRVRPVNALGGGVPEFGPANARPAAPSSVGGTLKVAAMNLLNYFNSVSDCRGGCRGATTEDEFKRQWPKTVRAISQLDADVLGLIELENDGYGSESAIVHLVTEVNKALGSDVYGFIDADAATGQTDALGTDAIKVALIYKKAKVKPVGATAALNSGEFVNGGDVGPRNRPALAQAFRREHDGGRFVVVVNHLKSKGSACTGDGADTDGQGNCNGVRAYAAQRLVEWLRTDPTDTGEPDVLIVGDLNSYAQEDPIRALTTGGYANLIAQKLGPKAYSYVFDGQWGYLDYALGSVSIGPQVTGVTEWHINADEPSVLDYNVEFKFGNLVDALYAPDQYRVADHDPIVVGLNLTRPPASYTFGGFLSPIASFPSLNEVNAGQAVPVTFSLGGNEGANIFERGYPASRQINCGTGKIESAATAIDTPGNSGLSYAASTDTYTYVWKTQRGWVGTCRELVVRLRDETQHKARFRFVR